jgi:hypothetical protein
MAARQPICKSYSGYGKAMATRDSYLRLVSVYIVGYEPISNIKPETGNV